MRIFLIAAAGLALAACGGAQDAADEAANAAGSAVEATADAAGDVADAAGDMASDAADSVEGALNGMTRADYLAACAAADGITAEQCECTLNAYETVGLEFSDLDDTDKVTEAMSSMTPDQMQAFAGCMS